MRYFQVRAALAAMALATALTGAAHAQVIDNNCRPETNKDRIWEEELISAHAGFAFVAKIQRSTCAFVNKVTDIVYGQAKAANPNYDSLPEPQKKSLFDRLFTSDDVMAAASPGLMPSAALATNRAATDRLLAQYQSGRVRTPGTTVGDGILPGKQVYYEGELKGGAPNGVGVMLYPSGEMNRGRYKDGLLTGQGEAIFPQGWVSEGRFGDGKLVGGASQAPDGTVRAGAFDADGSPLGKVEITYPNGEGQTQYLDKDGKLLAQGPLAPNGVEPQDPPPPPGAPPEPSIPVWSPSSSTNQLIEYTMRWGRNDPGSMLHLASMDPAFKNSPFDAAFCRPIMGSLTADEKAMCGIKDEPPAQANNGCGPSVIAGSAGGRPGAFGGLAGGGLVGGVVSCAPSVQPARPGPAAPPTVIAQAPAAPASLPSVPFTPEQAPAFMPLVEKICWTDALAFTRAIMRGATPPDAEVRRSLETAIYNNANESRARTEGVYNADTAACRANPVAGGLNCYSACVEGVLLGYRR